MKQFDKLTEQECLEMISGIMLSKNRRPDSGIEAILNQTEEEKEALLDFIACLSVKEDKL